MTNSQFGQYLQEPGVVEVLSARLFTAHNAYCEEYNLANPCSVPMLANFNEIIESMPKISKSTFQQFRALDITPTQMRTQVLFGPKQSVFKGADEFRGVLSPDLLRGPDYPGLLSRLLE